MCNYLFYFFQHVAQNRHFTSDVLSLSAVRWVTPLSPSFLREREWIIHQHRRTEPLLMALIPHTPKLLHIWQSGKNWMFFGLELLSYSPFVTDILTPAQAKQNFLLQAVNTGLNLLLHSTPVGLVLFSCYTVVLVFILIGLQDVRQPVKQQLWTDQLSRRSRVNLFTISFLLRICSVSFAQIYKLAKHNRIEASAHAFMV